MSIYFKDKVEVAGTSDTGEDTTSSIRPPLDNEHCSEQVLGRSLDNLRERTEEVKRSSSIDDYFNNLERAMTRSIVRVNSSTGAIELGGTYKLYMELNSGVKSYYLEPETANDKVIINGALERGMQYNLTKTCFTSFYGSGVGAGNNPKLGLQNIGESICLRVPKLTSTEIAASPKDMGSATMSSLTPAKEALVSSSNPATIENWLLTDSVTNGDRVLVRTPIKNKLEFTLNSSKAIAAEFIAELDSAISSGTATTWAFQWGDDVNNLNTLQLSSNHTTVIAAQQTYHIVTQYYQEVVPNLDFVASGSLILKLTLSTQVGGQNVVDISPSSVATHGVEVTQSVGTLPTNEYLIPLATHAGDKITVHGVGDVTLQDIDRMQSEGSFVGIRSDGQIVLDTGRAALKYHLRSDIKHDTLAAAGATLRNESSTSLPYYTIRLSLSVPEAPTQAVYRLSGVKLIGYDTWAAATNTTKEIGVYYEVNASSRTMDGTKLAAVELDTTNFIPIIKYGDLGSDDFVNSDGYVEVELPTALRERDIDKEDDALLIYFFSSVVGDNFSTNKFGFTLETEVTTKLLSSIYTF